MGLGPGGRLRFLGGERELRLGVCWFFRLFYVAPETTARFSCIDDQSRDLSPPWLLFYHENMILTLRGWFKIAIEANDICGIYIGWII